jgi:polysaccharide biosynthesis/export protein
MPCSGSIRSGRIRRALWVVLLLGGGCSAFGESLEDSTPPRCPDGPAGAPGAPGAPGDVSAFRPRPVEAKKAVADLSHELAMVSLSTYVIAAPDVLQIDALRLIPKPPYRVSPLDVLGIQTDKALPMMPIAGLFAVEPDGTINLGFDYGHVRVEGLTLDEVKPAILNYLKLRVPNLEVTAVGLVESRGLQQVRGPHLVRPDGTIGLGVYGSVHVEGLTIEEARAAIEEHLSAFVMRPEVSVDVAGFNSKVYYVITEGAGPGGSLVAKFPIQGQTTVLDALSQVNGLSVVSAKHLIYLVRPTPSACCNGDKCGCRDKGDEAVYHVCWHDVVGRGKVCTNYQVLPGDRIYVKAAPLIVTDTYLGLVLAPFERLFADVGLGNATVRSFLFPIPKVGQTVLTTPGF